MRPASAALKTFLEATGPANRACVQIDLYTVALVTGETFRWTGGNQALSVPAAGFPTGSINAGANRVFSSGPRFGRSRVATKIGVEPAELDLEVFAGAGDLVGTQSIAAAVRLGLFDGATVELDRFFAPPLASGAAGLDVTLGCLLWFQGRIAEAEIGRSAVRIKVKSLMSLLEITQWPRRIFQSSCNHVFGGVMCGYDRTLGKNAAGVSTGVGAVTVTAAAGSTETLINAAAAVSVNYREGTIEGLTGANAGYRRTIAHNGNGSQVGLFQPFLYPVAAADTFTALPGCDHTHTYCETVLNNLARYGGYPHIPPPEMAVLWLLSIFSGSMVVGLS